MTTTIHYFSVGASEGVSFCLMLLDGIAWFAVVFASGSIMLAKGSTMPKNLTTSLFLIIFIGVVLSHIVLLVVKHDRYQYDFRAFHYASHIYFNEGGDPYDFEQVQALAAGADHQQNMHPFIYPLHTMAVFAPLKFLGFYQSYAINLLLKVFALCLIVYMTYRLFDRAWDQVGLALFLLGFGLNGALMADLRAGNITTFETAMFLSAFVAWKEKRYGWFSCLIIAAGFFKLVLLSFLGLLIFAQDRGAWKKALVPTFIFALYVAAVGVYDPENSFKFLKLVAGFGHSSQWAVFTQLDASLINVIKGFIYVTGSFSLEQVYLVYQGAVVIIGLATLAALVTLQQRGADARILLSFAALSYALVTPKMAIYNLMLYAVPCAILVGILPRFQRVGWTVLAAIPFFLISRYGFGWDDILDSLSIWQYIWTYATWYLFAGLWLMVVVQIIGNSALTLPQMSQHQARSVVA